jgi:hypothetical protein
MQHKVYMLSFMSHRLKLNVKEFIYVPEGCADACLLPGPTARSAALTLQWKAQHPQHAGSLHALVRDLCQRTVAYYLAQIPSVWPPTTWTM